MEPTNYKRPMKAIISCKAKMQLLRTVDDQGDWFDTVDDTLLNELTTTLVKSNRYQTLYDVCHSRQETDETDRQLINELVDTYRQVSQRQQDPLIQSLNALL